jgi:hypothetical protein
MARDPQPEINPYAPSAIPEPLARPADRGIGVWRDGSEIVIHPQAELPRFCLVTGEKARYGYPLRIVWGYPPVAMRSLNLIAPLSDRVHQLCRRRRRQAILGFLTAVVLAGLAIVSYRFVGLVGMMLSLGQLLVVVPVSLYFHAQYSQFLYLSSVEGNYLRLKGADHRFLAKLPPWQA